MALSTYLYRSNVIFLLALICGIILPQGFPNRQRPDLAGIDGNSNHYFTEISPRFLPPPRPAFVRIHPGQCHELSCFGKFHYFGEYFSDPQTRALDRHGVDRRHATVSSHNTSGQFIARRKNFYFYRSGWSLFGRLVNYTINRFRVS